MLTHFISFSLPALQQQQRAFEASVYPEFCLSGNKMCSPKNFQGCRFHSAGFSHGIPKTKQEIPPKHRMKSIKSKPSSVHRREQLCKSSVKGLSSLWHIPTSAWASAAGFAPHRCFVFAPSFFPGPRQWGSCFVCGLFNLLGSVDIRCSSLSFLFPCAACYVSVFSKVPNGVQHDDYIWIKCWN